MRVILAFILALALMGAAVALGAADDVRVRFADGKTKSFNLSDYPGRADVDDSYTIRNSQGARVEPVEGGYSIQKILDIAGIEGPIKGYVQIEGDQGEDEVVLLDRPNLRDSAYDDGPPVFYDDDGEIVFLSPERDANNAQNVFSAAGSLVITEFSEQLLHLRVKASETEIDPGDTVDLEAILRQDSGSDLASSIDWAVTGLIPEGQGVETGRNAHYEFPDAGVATITATVKENRKTGTDSVDIQVGDPVDSDQNQTGGGLNNDYYAPDYGPYYGDNGAATPTYPDSSDNGSIIPDSPPAKTPDPIETGEEVTGELLSETAVYVPPPPEELLGVRSGTPDEGTNWTTPGIALGGALVVGLLGFGAGREFESLNAKRLRNLLPV